MRRGGVRSAWSRRALPPTLRGMGPSRKRAARPIEGLKDRLHRRRLRREARRERGAWAQRLSLRLADDVEGLLGSLYRGEAQPGMDGRSHAIEPQVRISREQGLLLYHLCRERRPALTLEVGLAYGYSTIYLLAALRDLGQGRHIAIDPLQSSHWHGIGARRAAELGLAERFTLIEEPAERALPRLEAEGRRVQLAYIDGDHKFEAVLGDFTLVARLCDPGALVVLDDLWLPSVRCALRFIEANRADWRLIRSPLGNACILEKTGEDRRSWDHFVRF